MHNESVRDDLSGRLRVYAGFGLFAALSRFLVALSRSIDVADWGQLRFSDLSGLGTELVLGCLLGLFLGCSGFGEFRPWKPISKFQVKTSPWKRVQGRVALALLAVAVCLLLPGLTKGQVLAQFVLGLTLWAYFGYQRWESSFAGKTQHLHRFFGLEWCVQHSEGRSCWRRVYDPLAGADVPHRRKSLPCLEGPRSDDQVYAKHSGQAFLVGLIAYGLSMVFLLAHHRDFDIWTLLATAIVPMPLVYLVFVAALQLASSRMVRVQLPQPRSASNPILRDQPAPMFGDLGCHGLMLFSLGGGQMLFLLLMCCIAIAVAASVAVGVSPELTLLLFMLAVFLQRRRAGRRRIYYELEPGSATLWRHRVEAPYQLSESLGQVAALGLLHKTFCGYLPVAYLTNGQPCILSRRGPGLAESSEAIAGLALKLLVLFVPPSMTAKPEEIGRWVREGTLQQEIGLWPHLEPLHPRPPRWLPPLD